MWIYMTPLPPLLPSFPPFFSLPSFSSSSFSSSSFSSSSFSSSFSFSSSSSFSSLSSSYPGVYCLQCDTDKAVTGGGNNVVLLWDINKGESTRSFRGHTQEIVDWTLTMFWTIFWKGFVCVAVQLCVQYNQSLIASSSADSTIRIWEHTGTRSLIAWPLFFFSFSLFSFYFFPHFASFSLSTLLQVVVFMCCIIILGWWGVSICRNTDWCLLGTGRKWMFGVQRCV